LIIKKHNAKSNVLFLFVTDSTSFNQLNYIFMD
jgi:hypothetical protein